MSDTYTDTDVAERDQADEQHIEDEPPLVQAYELHGGYWGATLSQIGDPDAPNLTGQIKTRHILAVDAESLGPQMVACLISDFGMLQKDAAELPVMWLVEGAAPEVTPEEPAPEPEPGPERPEHLPAPESGPEPQPHYDDDVRAEQEPEDTARHVTIETQRTINVEQGQQPQPQHIEQHIEHQHVDAQYIDQKPQREA